MEATGAEAREEEATGAEAREDAGHWVTLLRIIPGTCYVGLNPLVQSHVNTDNPVTLSIPRQKRGNKEIRRSRGEKGWPQDAGHRPPESRSSVLQTGREHDF